MQQHDLYVQAQKGDEESLSALIRKHTPLVHVLSRRFTWQEDAFQAGCIGLVYAIRHYDISYGVQFSTYAVPHILGEMRRAIYGRESWRTRSLMRRVREIREKVAREEMRDASVQEIAAHVGCTAAELTFLLERMTAQKDGGVDEIENMPDPSSQKWLERFMLRDLIQRLPRDEQTLLYLRYGQNRNQKEVAQLLHTSQASISRMESRACHTLRMAWHERLYPCH